MSLLEIVKSDITQAATAVGTAAYGSLSTDIILQRLAWTTAIIVSLCAIARYGYRFYKWLKKYDLPDND